MMDAREAFNLIMLLLLIWAFYRVVDDRSNDLEFWHLYSTRAADGKIYLDLDKIGMNVGLVFSTWVIVWLTYTAKLEITYFAAWLLYASGMGAFSKWARGIISNRYGHQAPAAPTAALPAKGMGAP